MTMCIGVHPLTRRKTLGLLAAAGTAPALGGCERIAPCVVSQEYIEQLGLDYGRAQELEADRLGLFMMADAGYDPHEAAELWRRMDQIGGGGPAILSTNPAPQDRIEAIEALIPEVLDAAVS